MLNRKNYETPCHRHHKKMHITYPLGLVVSACWFMPAFSYSCSLLVWAAPAVPFVIPLLRALSRVLRTCSLLSWFCDLLCHFSFNSRRFMLLNLCWSHWFLRFILCQCIANSNPLVVLVTCSNDSIFNFINEFSPSNGLYSTNYKRVNELSFLRTRIPLIHFQAGSTIYDSRHSRYCEISIFCSIHYFHIGRTSEYYDIMCLLSD